MQRFADATVPSANEIDSPGIPVIDLSPLARAEALRDVASQVHRACLDHGFFTLVGHGIPAPLMHAVLTQCRALFALDDKAKRAVAAKSPFGRGYARMGGSTLSGAAHVPVKEEFYLGRDPVPGRSGETPWPPGLPEFRATILAYVEAMHDLAQRLMAALALSLDLAEDYFAAFSERPIASLRLVRYPPEGAEAGAHTDFGTLTLLLQDGTGGLQVLDRASGGWIDVSPVPGSIVVNIGDLMERWTNGRYRSTPHRVIHPPGVARHSVPFFFTGAGDYPVVCLPACLEPGEKPAYPPTTPAAYLAERRRQQGF